MTLSQSTFRTVTILLTTVFAVASAVSVHAAPETSSNDRPTLYLVGDSTVKNGSGRGDGGLWGWGQVFASHLDSDRIKLDNQAIGGRSSRTFLTEGRWDRVRDQLKPGDFVLIQFGHNDGGELFNGNRPRASLKGNGDESRSGVVEATGKHEKVHSYGWYIRHYVGVLHARVVERPELWPLVFRIPAVLGAAEREHALLGAAFFLVSARTAKGGVEAMHVERLLQPLRLHDIGVDGRAVRERVDALRDTVRVRMHDQLQVVLLRDLLAQFVHRLEFPERVDVQQGKRQRGRIERLERDVQHRGAVLADRIQHHGLVAFGDHLAHDLDAFGFQTLQVRKPLRIHQGLIHGGRSERFRRGNVGSHMFFSILTTVRPIARPSMY